ncbi:hypothetical protein F5Y09DRAFT_357896 [Xylaria sp. FL1042]|nr:hypothetical protein F5Y09DRAFT_357896 [Xylaria sp. FL1042]
MTTDSALHTADLDFRNEVIDKLLAPVDWAQHLKDSLGQFLRGVTADVNHKHLAYHLFCIVTLYISKQTTLDEEQKSVICRTVEQLRRDWGGGNAPLENSSALGLHSENGHVKQLALSSTDTDGYFKQSGSSNIPMLPTETGGAMAFSATDATSGDADQDFKALHHPSVTRSATPDSFVREGEKCILKCPNFHGAVSSDDGADLKSHYPFGFRVMSKQGWWGQNGLGPDGSGIQRPLDANNLSYTYGQHGSPSGLGYEGRINGKLTMLEEEKLPSPHTNGAKAWQSYVADPRTGDERAISNSKCDTAKVVCQNMAENVAPPKGNTKIVFQDQSIITDTWKKPSSSPRASQAQKNVRQRISGKIDPDDFVVYTDNSQG